jgi:hypothetical protein
VLYIKTNDERGERPLAHAYGFSETHLKITAPWLNWARLHKLGNSFWFLYFHLNIITRCRLHHFSVQKNKNTIYFLFSCLLPTGGFEINIILFDVINIHISYVVGAQLIQQRFSGKLFINRTTIVEAKTVKLLRNLYF